MAFHSPESRQNYGRFPCATERPARTHTTRACRAKRPGLLAALGYLVTERASGLRLYFLSSAAIHTPSLEALRADVLLPAIVGRNPAFTRTLMQTFRPRLVVPSHFDDFTVPIEQAMPLERADVQGFEEEVRAASAGSGRTVEIRWPSPLTAFHVNAAELTDE